MSIIEIDNRLDSALRDSIIEGIDEVDAGSFASNRWGKASFMENAANDYDLLIAAVDEKTGMVSGFGLMRCLGDAEVLRIAVFASMRRRGMGQKLLMAMLRAAAAKGADTMFLEVRSKNLPARGLYERAGFSELGTRKSYYHDPPDDAVIMSMSLLDMRQ